MQEYIQKSMSFPMYIGFIDQLLAEGKTTGPNQSEAMLSYASINRQRMRRLENTIEIDPDLRRVMGSLDVDWIWLVITEGWCGDASQNIPIIEKIAAANPRIETRYNLRDENPELIDRFLTNGARAIPKLIVIDRQDGSIRGMWGSRPKAAQEYFLEMKAAGLEKANIMENLQRWYISDRGRSIQKEFLNLVEEWTRRPFALAA